MKGFITEDFLLQNEFAKHLYHRYAKELPVIDYHCHLSPEEIARNRKFENITKAWLEGDHYKWRAMRTLGIAENYITGNAPDEEKFQKWSFAVPLTVRNPLYHWTHLELLRYFNIDALLTPETSREIFLKSSSMLNGRDFSTRSLLQKMKVEVVCTTDDPADNLDHHKKIKADNFSVKVLPTFRPDKSYSIENRNAYKDYIQKLSACSGTNIVSFENLLAALSERIRYFHEHGCRLADHGLEQMYFPAKGSLFNPGNIFKKIISGETVTREETEFYKYKILHEVCKMYHEHGWVQQFHIGALRNNNQRMLRKLGPDTGFDSIGDFRQAAALAQFLSELNDTDQLAKTILYNLNPADNEVFATMAGNFNDGSVKGKIQYGSAWWFLDQKDGMQKQINSLSNLGLLSCFIGMLTDSRSFLSYPRHEYFRRILCNMIGTDVVNGELPWDEAWLGKTVSDICYHNAKSYFNF